MAAALDKRILSPAVQVHKAHRALGGRANAGDFRFDQGKGLIIRHLVDSRRRRAGEDYRAPVYVFSRQLVQHHQRLNGLVREERRFQAVVFPVRPFNYAPGAGRAAVAQRENPFGLASGKSRRNRNIAQGRERYGGDHEIGIVAAAVQAADFRQGAGHVDFRNHLAQPDAVSQRRGHGFRQSGCAAFDSPHRKRFLTFLACGSQPERRVHALSLRLRPSEIRVEHGSGSLLHHAEAGSHAEIHGNSRQSEGGIRHAVCLKQFLHGDVVCGKFGGKPVVQVFQRIKPGQQAHADHDRRHFAFVVGHPVDWRIGPFAGPHPCSVHIVGHGHQAADVREQIDVKPRAQIDGPRIRTAHLAGAVFRACFDAIGSTGPAAETVRPLQQDHVDAEVGQKQRAVEPGQAASDHDGRGLLGGEAICGLQERVGQRQGGKRERSLEDLSSSDAHSRSSEGVNGG